MKLFWRVAFLLCLGIAILILSWYRSTYAGQKLKSPLVERSANSLDMVSAEQGEVLQKINHRLAAMDKDLLEDEVDDNGMHPWDVWHNMVSERSLTVPDQKQVNKILQKMKHAKIISAKNGYKGTQLKALLFLDGPSQQAVVFKPGRYKRDHVITGKPYDGYDRHNGEIAAFHLDRILGFNRAPPVVGRKIDLQKDVMPVAEKKILDTFFTNAEGNTCFYGACYYCKKSDPACGDGSIMEGSLTLWLPDKWKVKKQRHPWQRTYKDNKKAKWETDNSYCEGVMEHEPYKSGPRLLDIADTALFDFMIGNADRHHYEYLGNTGPNNGMLIHLDNAKSFGNPYTDEMSILAPIYQCCRFRKSTYLRFKTLYSDDKRLASKLEAAMQGDPLAPILTGAHLKAVDRRFSKINQLLDGCLSKDGEEKVLQPDRF